MKTADIAVIYRLWNEILECNPDLTYSEWSEKAAPLLESYAKQHAIEFLRAMSAENPSLKADENTYEQWITPKQTP